MYDGLPFSFSEEVFSVPHIVIKGIMKVVLKLTTKNIMMINDPLACLGRYEEA